MPTDIMANFRRLVDDAERAIAARNEANKIRIQVGAATCEKAAGADDVHDEFRKHIASSGRNDIVLHRTGCTGRCSCEPIVGVIIPGLMPVKYQRVDRQKVHTIFTAHVLGGQPQYDLMLDASGTGTQVYEFLFCQAERCRSVRGKDLGELFREKLRAADIDEHHARAIPANCFGLCRTETIGLATHILVRPNNVVYRVRSEADLDEIIRTHVLEHRIVDRLRVQERAISQRFFDLYGDVAFFNRQTRIALRNSGIIDPESLDEYLHVGGFESLAKVLDRGDGAWVIEEIRRSHLRGRGGGGYPSGLKWSAARSQPADVKYIICNADEGDPGAFMDRSMFEGDPFSVIEGMTIGGFAIGACHGFFYVRAEYPLAIERIEKALVQCRRSGLLGRNILGSGFDFDLEIRLGAGAFVCGEETALIHSIEGERGQPRVRPPYPTDSGLWGKPTVINNVETFANVAPIIQYGAEWVRQIGTPTSGGTKVFALAGKVQHTGLVEVPMGTTLREIVFDIGGGPPAGKKLKAIQTGGPAGGCIPAQFLDTIVDFDSLTAIGSIMGSGGMIVMDEDDCMVDIAKFFLTFSQDESCGKCTPCREGTKRMLEIIERITSGAGTLEDLNRLERLGNLVKKASLCGLGRAAPNPVLSTLKYFRDEYGAHVVEKRCPARKCVALIHYEIDPGKCVGCTLCARNCPVTCISGQPRKPHVIDPVRCIKCGRCFQVCRFDAVLRL